MGRKRQVPWRSGASRLRMNCEANLQVGWKPAMMPLDFEALLDQVTPMEQRQLFHCSTRPDEDLHAGRWDKAIAQPPRPPWRDYLPKYAQIIAYAAKSPHQPS